MGNKGKGRREGNKNKSAREKKEKGGWIEKGRDDLTENIDQ